MGVKISGESLRELEKNLDKSADFKILQNVICNNGIQIALKRHLTDKSDPFSFSHIQPVYKIADQKHSGRCWIFAALNIVKTFIIRKYNLNDISLSANFIAFYDLLEKSNYFMETIISNIESEPESRLMAYLLLRPIQDAGQWDMFCDLVQKYGIVPEYAMPDTFCAENTGELISVLCDELRKFCVNAKELYRKGAAEKELRKYKKNILSSIYRTLCITLGQPPKYFNIEMYDKRGTVINIKDITPVGFYKEFLNIDLREKYIAVINCPMDSRPFYKAYKIKNLGDVIEGKGIKYLNLPLEKFKELIISQLMEGEPVWFGCDSRNYVEKKRGVLDTNIYDYSLINSPDSLVNKGTRLEYGITCLTHAMVFRGVNIRNGVIDRWLVENSYGPDAGHKGCLSMTAEWFDSFVYEAVIERDRLDKELLKIYDSNAVELELWDPIGALASI